MGSRSLGIAASSQSVEVSFPISHFCQSPDQILANENQSKAFSAVAALQNVTSE